MSSAILCLYVTGTPAARVAERHGTFVDWFGCLLAEHDVQVEVFDGTGGRLPEDRGRFAGFVLTGSPASLTTPEPWMDAARALVVEAYVSHTPLLGVCFGHQLIGSAFGSVVVRNPGGWQMAAHPVELTARGRIDPLFEGVPERFHALFSHQDVVDPATISRASELEVLAGNGKARIAAVAAGPWVRGVQFHPELTADISRSCVEMRRDELERECLAHGAAHEHPDELLRTLRDTPESQRVLHNFLDHFVKQPG